MSTGMGGRGGGGGGGGGRFGGGGMGMMRGGGGGGGGGGGSSMAGMAMTDHQSSTGHSIHMRGLPFAANEQDVIEVSDGWWLALQSLVGHPSYTYHITLLCKIQLTIHITQALVNSETGLARLIGRQ